MATAIQHMLQDGVIVEMSAPDRAADIAAAVVVLSIPHGKGAIHAGYDHPCKTLEHGEIATSAFGPVLVFCHLRAIPIVAMVAP